MEEVEEEARHGVVADLILSLLRSIRAMSCWPSALFDTDQISHLFQTLSALSVLPDSDPDNPVYQVVNIR